MNKTDIPKPTEYTFVFIRDYNNNYYHPILVELDICNESINLKRSHLVVYKKNSVVIDKVLNSKHKYLIQTKEMGNFGYYSVGKPIHIFENQVEAESDIYHYFYMQFSG